jgi:polysaccharide pyruvyl transferase WcaK-like protein
MHTSRSVPKLVLLNDNAEQNNWGAQATAYAVKKMLRDAIPGLMIFPLTYGWLTREYREISTPFSAYYTERPPRWLRRWSKRAEFFPAVVDDYEHVADEWMAGRGGPMAHEFLAAARDADIIVHNGEHSIFRNTTEGCRALFLLWFARTRLGKPSCEINHTAHLTSIVPIMPGMVRLVYPTLDLVTVREPCSLRNLFSLGIENVELVPDVVFNVPESDYAEEPVRNWKSRNGLTNRPYFCLSASGLPMSTSRNGTTSSVSELVRRLKRIVPQAVLLAKDRPCQFLEQVAQETDSAYFGPEHSFFEVWPLLRDARFLVSGHYHYVIMGAMVGCPFVPLSTRSHKMHGICEHLEWHLRQPYDATALYSAMDTIVEQAVELDRSYEQFSELLRRRSDHLCSQAARNAEAVRQKLS